MSKRSEGPIPNKVSIGKESVLIIYGSLAPGEKNHHIISHIPGEWHRATIKGKIKDNGWSDNRSAYPEFNRVKDESEAETIHVQAFISKELHQYWTDIDEFEGTELYGRKPIDCVLENGQKTTAFIYERL